MMKHNDDDEKCHGRWPNRIQTRSGMFVVHGLLTVTLRKAYTRKLIDNPARAKQPRVTMQLADACMPC